MPLRSLLAAAALAASSLAAHADTIYAYDISGTGNFGLSGTVSGMLTIDVTTGMVQSVSLTASSTDGTSTFSGADSQVPVGKGPVIYVGGDGSSTPDSTEAKFSIDAGSLIDYNSSSDNAFDLRLPDGDSYVGHLTDGTSVPLATTPEPSSIALLGTGLLGMAGALRKRYMGA